MMESKRDSVNRGYSLLLALGIISLAVGISLLAFGAAFSKPETVFMKTVQTTLMGNYDFMLHADKNDWLEFDVNSSAQSYLYVSPGPSMPYGTRHADSFQLNETEDYHVAFGSIVSTPQMRENITYSGYFRVQRQRIASPVLMGSGVALVVVATIFLLTPVISPLLLRPNVLATMGHLRTSSVRLLRSLPKAVSFFMLLIGTFLAAFGLFSLSSVRTDPFFNYGSSVYATLFGSLLLAIGIILEIIRRKYPQS